MTDPVAGRRPEADVGTLALEDFTPFVGEPFRVWLEGGDGTTLALAEAEAAKGERAADAFSLLFQGPETPFLEQRLYEVEHPKLGRFGLFLVPVGRSERGYAYEAVFTRM